MSSQRINADLKFVQDTPIEEVNKLARENKLVFIGNKASQLWRDKNAELDKTKKDEQKVL